VKEGGGSMEMLRSSKKEDGRLSVRITFETGLNGFFAMKVRTLDLV